VKRTVCVLLAVALLFVSASAQRPAAPIVILVSFDGWRADYIDQVSAPNLNALAARGVRAKELIPAFPVFTFPNHYTIVTGLYPAHHGIVGNTIDDPGFPERFTLSSDTAKDPRWWGGEPVWVTAIRQGRRAAAVFWPGSEAPIDGVRPTFWLPFDDELSNAGRVAEALKLLALPDDQRPSFVTVYFSEVDHAGHDYGPESSELRTAAAHLDQALGQLVEGVTRLGLTNRATFVVVSDHGMAAVSESRLIFLDDYLDLKTVDVVDMGAFLSLRPRPPATVDAVHRKLRGKHPQLTIYKRDETPQRFHYRGNPRIQPILGIVGEGWTVTSHVREAERKPDAKPRRGAHGYDPRLASMRGLFVAAGPSVKHGMVVAPFENVHVYDFLCALLGLTPAKNDGDAAVTSRFFAR
jgi:predicted AlkP superfamily pyrophosphatase or phosphodiesterase